MAGATGWISGGGCRASRAEAENHAEADFEGSDVIGVSAFADADAGVEGDGAFYEALASA